MIQEPFPHDVRAVLGAAGNGLSLKKIFAATVFLLAAYAVYLTATWGALIYDGSSFGYLWQSYGFFPVQMFTFDSAFARLLYFAGIVAGLLCVALAVTAVAIITFEQIRGNVFFSASKAIGFAIRRIPALLAGFLSLIVFIVIMYILGVLFGLIGRIPGIGEILISIFYLVPVFFGFFFAVFVIFVAVVSVVLLPVIIASQKKREIFDAILQLFSVLISTPLRFFTYLGISTLLAKVASFVFAYACWRAMQLTHLVLVVGGGEDIDRMFNTALHLLPYDSGIVAFMTSVFPGIAFGFEISRWGYAGDTTAGSIILAVSFAFVFALAAGYAVSVFGSGMARGYAVIRRMKDDYFIADEEPLESIEDYANPPFLSQPDESRE